MKLRFVEREANTDDLSWSEITFPRRKQKILQYWSPINDWDEDGNWIDVPLGYEELDK